MLLKTKKASILLVINVSVLANIVRSRGLIADVLTLPVPLVSGDALVEVNTSQTRNEWNINQKWEPLDFAVCDNATTYPALVERLEHSVPFIVGFNVTFKFKLSSPAKQINTLRAHLVASTASTKKVLATLDVNLCKEAGLCPLGDKGVNVVLPEVMVPSPYNLGVMPPLRGAELVAPACSKLATEDSLSRVM